MNVVDRASLTSAGGSIATPPTVKKFVTCSRLMAILSNKDENNNNENINYFFVKKTSIICSDVVKKLKS
jgi:hypothetical protein